LPKFGVLGSMPLKVKRVLLDVIDAFRLTSESTPSEKVDLLLSLYESARGHVDVINFLSLVGYIFTFI
jgi:hypothetical protein